MVPVTKVTKDDIKQMEKYPQRNEAYIAIKKVLACIIMTICYARISPDMVKRYVNI